MIDDDVLAALVPVVAALEALGTSYRVGGSVASSALGVPRSTLDVDIVAILEPGDAAPLARMLQGEFYADRAMIADAIRTKSSFNLVHLATMLKVDVFVRKDRRFDREAFSRSRSIPLDKADGARHFDVTTPEDIILHKLEWYRLGGETSDRQWNDVLGVLRIQSDDLDEAYLERWAADLGLDDLLERARAEVSGGV